MAGNKQGQIRMLANDETFETVAKLMAMGYQKAELRRMLEEAYETRICDHTYEDIRAGARKVLLGRTKVTREMMKGRSLEFYYSLVQDESQSAHLRMKAQENIDKLFALGQIIEIQDNKETAEKIQDLLRAAGATIPDGE